MALSSALPAAPLNATARYRPDLVTVEMRPSWLIPGDWARLGGTVTDHVPQSLLLGPGSTGEQEAREGTSAW